MNVYSPVDLVGDMGRLQGAYNVVDNSGMSGYGPAGSWLPHGNGSYETASQVFSALDVAGDRNAYYYAPR